MDAANRAPRCNHVKANGVRCASPAMRELPFCFFHEKFYNPAYDDSFPPLEDANSVQCAILQVLNALKRKVITPLEARVFLYGLKAAAINSRRTTFEPIMQAQVTEYPLARRQQKDSSDHRQQNDSSDHRGQQEDLPNCIVIPSIARDLLLPLGWVRALALTRRNQLPFIPPEALHPPPTLLTSN